MLYNYFKISSFRFVKFHPEIKCNLSIKIYQLQNTDREK